MLNLKELSKKVDIALANETKETMLKWLNFKHKQQQIIKMKRKKQTIPDNIYISIAKDFSETPGARKKEETRFSGEEFRESILCPKLKEAIKNNVKLIIDLDGTDGYANSFFDEAFGGLVRYDNYSFEIIHNHVILETKEDEFFIDYIWKRIRYYQDAGHISRYFRKL